MPFTQGRPAATGASPVRLPGNDDRLATIRGAVQRQRALRITYYTATRDEITERVVDPMRVLLAAGRGYLEAWCRRAEAVRLFRVDRIDGMVELDEPAAPPPQAQPSEVAESVFTPTPDLPLVRLRVGRGRKDQDLSRHRARGRRMRGIVILHRRGDALGRREAGGHAV